jgi:hypothetical protein
MAAWTIEERVFMLNHADYCIKHGLSYKDTAVAAFSTKFKRDVPWDSLRMQATYVLKKKFGVSSPSVQELGRQGTDCIDVDNLPQCSIEYSKVMDVQRKELSLEKWMNDTNDTDDKSLPNTSSVRRPQLCLTKLTLCRASRPLRNLTITKISPSLRYGQPLRT